MAASVASCTTNGHFSDDVWPSLASHYRKPRACKKQLRREYLLGYVNYDIPDVSTTRGMYASALWERNKVGVH